MQEILEQLHKFSTPKTRVLINFYSRFWEIPLKLAQIFKAAKPVEYQNWLTQNDLGNLFQLCDFEVIRSWTEVLFPFNIPVITPFLNRYLARVWPFNLFCYDPGD